MHRLFILLLGATMLSSCATIVTRKTYPMAVRSNVPRAKIIYKDSNYALPTLIRVRRAKTPLSLKFVHNDSIRDLTIKARPNAAFMAGNLGWLQAAPIAYLIDLTTIKRFYYGRNLFINGNDTATTYPISRKRWQRYWAKSYEPHRGDFVLSFSLPVVNNFLFQPEGEALKNVWVSAQQ